MTGRRGASSKFIVCSPRKKGPPSFSPTTRYDLLHFSSSLHAVDAVTVSVFALHLLRPRLDDFILHLVGRFLAGVHKDQKAIGGWNVAINGDSLVVAARDQFTASRLDGVANLVNATGF